MVMVKFNNSEEMAYKTVLILLGVVCVSSQLYGKNSYHNACPRLYQKTFRGYVPKGNLTAGRFGEETEINSLKQCVFKCCIKEDCNVAFMTDDKCYHVTCVSSELCAPTLSLNTEAIEHVLMVLVRPVGDESWPDVIEQELQKEKEETPVVDREMYRLLTDPHRLEAAYRNMVDMDESSYEYSTPCNVGISETCMKNEECIQNFPKSRAGTCKCKAEHVRNHDGVCVLALEFKEKAITGMTEGLLDSILHTNISGPIPKKRLTVTAQSKEVRLPHDEVSITAFVDPPAPEGVKYQYDWSSLEQPAGSAAVKHQNGDQMQLSKLTEGLYTFKVSVSSDDAYGETFVNVTVLAPSRINKPPQIVITPANQTVKLPNTGAVLDASSSTDDNGIASWHWELQQGPLGYEPQLKDTPTLQLNDLTRPGNYTFKLTVTDTDKATNSSIANITVLKVTDYPPEANAGQDVIIYLPHNEITLNGNLSTDDHNITTWEWTKSAKDADKAVDMQDTRTPYLKLSHLEEGMYTFMLKVTDSANQSSTAEVHVFVKPPTNQPPVAEAGDNITISLPQTWVVLDASKSTDDNKIEAFKWEQVEGPSSVSFANLNMSVTNVTGLTKGRYVFKVYVTDDNKNVADDLVYVTVDQNKNQKPVAHAGGDFELELPRNVIFINGSKSSDDWEVVRWKWVRDDTSLAVGNIGEGSDETPILMLTNVVAGKYVLNLTVFDEQGLSDTDTVCVTVKEDPKLYYLVEITIETDVNLLSEAQYGIIKGKLALLVEDGTKLQVRTVKPERGTGRTVISFFVENADGKPVDANQVVQHLRQKIRMDESLLSFSVIKLQTVICQNTCSGHGVCDEQTRNCVCEAFWMQDLFKVYFGSDEDSDCRWSILYVVLGVVCSVIALVGSFWGVLYLCCNWCSKRRMAIKPTTYKLLEDTDELPPYSRKGNISDSDTDSDVVFESRNKAPRFNSEARNGHKSSRNGFTKINRRVKT